MIPGRSDAVPATSDPTTGSDVGARVDTNPHSGTHDIVDLRVLYDLHGSEIFRFCHRLVGDRGLAEEAMQETFLRAWRAQDRFDPTTGSLRTWMYAVARNVCIDALRARGRRFGLGSSDAAREPAEHAVPDQQDSGFEAMLSSWMLEEALRRIPANQRDALVLTYMRDRPYAEIADVLGIPEPTLRTRVFYGLKSLRKVLEEMGWHE